MGKIADQKRKEQDLFDKSLSRGELTERLFEQYNFSLDKTFKVEIQPMMLTKIDNAKIIRECLDLYVQGHYHIDYLNAIFYFENKEDHAIVLGFCTAHQIV